MSDEAALLRAIHTNPDDDTPRLVYADWLDENGQPERAEFIRVHVAWDRHWVNATPNEDLKRRLLEAWSHFRSKENPQILYPGDGVCGAYERGFPSAAAFDYYSLDFIDTAEEVFTAAPIRMMYLDEWSEYVGDQGEWREAFHRAASFARGVTGFGMELPRNRALIDHWEEYLHLPQTAGLRVLDFNFSSGEDSCPLVAELTHLTNLLVLDLTLCCRFGDWCLAQLTEAPHLQSLVALRLGADDEYLGSITSTGITSLVNSPYLTNLRQLVLNNHEDLDDEAVRLLTKWERLGQLEVLEISCRNITDVGVSLLSGCRQLQRLRRLVLDGTRLSPQVIQGVLDSPHLYGLTEFYLSPCPSDLPLELREQIERRFPEFASMTFDPPAICVEDRILARYR